LCAASFEKRFNLDIKKNNANIEEDINKSIYDDIKDIKMKRECF